MQFLTFNVQGMMTVPSTTLWFRSFDGMLLQVHDIWDEQIPRFVRASLGNW